MKKLILIAAMLIAEETRAEVSVEKAHAQKVDLSAEMLQNILANDPALGICRTGPVERRHRRRDSRRWLLLRLDCLLTSECHHRMKARNDRGHDVLTRYYCIAN
ncbi:hypothetical protein GJV06_09035 [Enterobacteriaceae bacterium RIT691]|nr:hypothetical protein [Enterobacteriaceae bacterium RIT691]